MDIRGYLQVAPNKRSFQTREGDPVFWLGDTAWACPGRASWEEWTAYVDERALQGFNVLQMNSLPQHDAYQPIFRDRKPFALLNEDHIDGKIFNWDYDSIDESYFDFLARMIDYANGKKMLVALVVVWFEHVPNSRLDVIPVHPGMTVEQGERYGSYLAEKLRDKNVAWIVSGDDEFRGEGVAAFYDAVARAVRAADPHGRIMTAHPVQRSGDTYHQADWLDFNMVQTGHAKNLETTFKLVRDEWEKQPAKPVLNAEPCYEKHPAWGDENNCDGYDVRMACWRSVLEGSLTGVTYGAEGIWNWAVPGDTHFRRSPEQFISWREALELPGAADVARMKSLLTTLPWQELKPSPGLLLSRHPSYVSVASTADGSLMLAYLPEGGAIRLNVSSLGHSAEAYWWDPGSGERVAAGPANGLEWFGNAPFARDALLVIQTSG